ncbi:MAG: HAD family hydrolase [Propionibacteriaceae bacterium]|jgi:HAD superfamily hydrolase (TIGR01549 family)|nr:HAD family hydrolase [Propionibacteriaceae bacterium]
MLTTIMFDVDGTLIDTEEITIASAQRTLRELVGVNVAAEDLEYVLGIPGTESMKRYATSEVSVEAIHAQWCFYESQLTDQAVLFSGVPELLAGLKAGGMKLGIVTSRVREEMDRDIDRLSLSPFFDTVITASDTERHKPWPDPLQEGLRRLGVGPDEAIYVGDSVYDMECAYAATVPFALATWGAKRIERFDRAAVMLQRPADVMGCVESL